MLMNSLFSLYFELIPTFKNIQVLALKMNELNFQSFFTTSDKQIRDIMNVIYRNKKLFYEMIIKLYESDS